MNLYSIERKCQQPGYGDCVRYRFRSKFNSCLGNWCADRDDAVREGEDHQKIILCVYPGLAELFTAESVD